MFGKANWAIVGLDVDSLERFQQALKTFEPFLASQLVQSIFSKLDGLNTLGINPFDNPRKDEGRDLGALKEDDLQKVHTIAKAESVDLQTIYEEGYRNYYGADEVAFRIHPTLPWYGMWFIANTNEDVSDLASIKEHISYTKLSRPYKFTGKEDKKVVDSAAQGWAELTRKQFPVLLDFDGGRVYIENTNEDMLIEVLAVLAKLGVKTYPLMWKFVEGDWVTKFLGASVLHLTTSGANADGKLFTDQINKRANDVRTFTGGELEPFEDPTVERIVEKYFAMIDPGTGLQYVLSPVATLTLYPGGSPITISNPSDLVNLIRNTSILNTAHLTFQEVETKETKKGTKTFRTDLFSFDINQNVILWDAGAALIRGFDIPNFKRIVMKEIRKTKQEMPISFYWSEWLRQMNEGIHTFTDNVATVLGVDRTGEFGIVEFAGGVSEAAVEVEEI
jgi:hypothetical protein